MGSKLSKAEMQAQWLHNPCILGVPIAQHGEKLKNGYFNPVYSGGQT